ncbi:MAG: amidohydrolase family protein [Bacillota bacterium]|nr:amidohydrolase family protein [Bacillota bacterium]MDW7676313.1 amidohydrolase family protein [Bacillota bacterium]
MKTDWLLQNAGIIDETGTFFIRKHLLIHQGKVGELLDEIPNDAAEDQTLDCSGLIITPGLVNLHTHSPMTLFRGLAEDVTIEDWFNREIWPYEKNMNASRAYAGAMAAIYEMIDYGVTAFADHYMFPEAIIQAVLDTGIRCDLAPTLFGVSETFVRDLQQTAALIQHHQGTNDRLSLRLGPHAPYTCQPVQLKAIIDVARVLETGIHIHISETRQQVADSLHQYEKTPFEILAEAGGLDVPAILAHGLWIQPEDRHLLSPDTTLAISPKTYLKLAMGQGHLWDKPQELPLAAGTDGAASSNTLNPIEQIQLFGLLGKHFGENATHFTTRELWQILMRGHQALPFHTGKLQPGMQADLVFWDLAHPGVMPVHDPLAAILYSSSKQQVKHVMIGGRWVKQEGRVCIDAQNIMDQMREKIQEIMAMGKGQAPIRF